MLLINYLTKWIEIRTESQCAKGVTLKDIYRNAQESDQTRSPVMKILNPEINIL